MWVEKLPHGNKPTSHVTVYDQALSAEEEQVSARQVA
jgi:hypothetical protein